MSIASEITRLQNAKNNLKTAINDLTDAEHKITDETIDEYVDFFQYIEGGGSGLPSEYQQVEYIQGTGTQYIDTTFLATGGMKAEYEVEYSSDIITINGGYIVGSHNRYSPYARNGGYYNNYQTIKGWELGYGDYYPKSSATITYGQKYKVEFQTIPQNAYLKVDDVTLLTDTRNTTMNCNTNVMLFTHQLGVYNNETKTKAKVYYVKIWDKDGNLVRDFIPCYRKYDQAVGVYDIVNKDFYTNSGSGVFLKGEDV